MAGRESGKITEAEFIKIMSSFKMMGLRFTPKIVAFDLWYPYFGGITKHILRTAFNAWMLATGEFPTIKDLLTAITEIDGYSEAELHSEFSKGYQDISPDVRWIINKFIMPFDWKLLSLQQKQKIIKENLIPYYQKHTTDQIIREASAVQIGSDTKREIKGG